MAFFFTVFHLFCWCDEIAVLLYEMRAAENKTKRATPSKAVVAMLFLREAVAVMLFE